VVEPQVHEGDFFWDKNARQQWPSVAEDQSKQLAEYREAIAEINRTTGAGINPDAVADDMQQVCWLTSLSLHRLPRHIGVGGQPPDCGVVAAHMLYCSRQQICS
jgi:hypothetical protein